MFRTIWDWCHEDPLGDALLDETRHDTHVRLAVSNTRVKRRLGNSASSSKKIWDIRRFVQVYTTRSTSISRSFTPVGWSLARMRSAARTFAHVAVDLDEKILLAGEVVIQGRL